MRIAGVEDPAACLFLDDSVSNMKAARAMGWTNVLVGTHARDGGELIVCEHADHIIRTVHDFEALAPEHFRDRRPRTPSADAASPVRTPPEGVVDDADDR